MEEKGPGYHVGRIFFKASISSSSVKSGIKLFCPCSSHFFKFLFSVLSSLDISILLTPAYCFMKMSAFLLSDVIQRSLWIMALLGELFSGVPFSDFITHRNFRLSPVLEEYSSRPHLFFGTINGHSRLLTDIKPFITVVGYILP